MNKIIGIYKIENKVNGKVYIGESNNIKKRWDEHIEDLNNNKHHSYKLQIAWNKYGKDNFSFEILEEIDKLETQYKTTMQLIYLEGKFTNKYNSIINGYNVEDTVKEILSGRKVIMSQKIDASYLKNLIKFNGVMPNKKSIELNENTLNEKKLDILPFSKFIDKLRYKYVINFSKSEFYYILQNRGIIDYKNKSYYLNNEFIKKGYFVNGKQQKNSYGYIFYQMLITELGEYFIIDLLNLQSK